MFSHFQLPVATQEAPDNRKYIERLEPILAKIGTGQTVAPLPYRLVVIDDEAPNAFAFPGGTIGVTTGLLDVLKDEIEVAFVMGHELGHFHNRDHLQGMGRTIGFRVIMALVFGGGYGGESFGNMIDFVFQRDYSQEREKMADRFGLALVAAAYGKVDGVNHLFQILIKEHTLPGWAYMFSTHPSPQERIDDLKMYALEMK